MAMPAQWAREVRVRRGSAMLGSENDVVAVL
jgi:hypothetical protein